MSEDLIKTLTRRDNISEKEAKNIITKCQVEIFEALDRGEGIDVIEKIFEDWLGLETDNLEEILSI